MPLRVTDLVRPIAVSRRHRVAASAVTLLLIATSSGCQNAATRENATQHSAPALVITPPTTPAAAAAVAPKNDIAAIFRAEAQHRPSTGPHVEDVLAAFQAAGAPATDVHQHLAKPFGADYCAGAEEASGVVVSICEFETPAAAAQGKTVSAKGLASIPNREIAQNGATTLTLRQRQHTSESQALVRRLRAAFEQLKK